jgi:hypothetical protein
MVGSVESRDQTARTLHFVVAEAGHHDLGQLFETKISEVTQEVDPQCLTQPDIGDEILDGLGMCS